MINMIITPIIFLILIILFYLLRKNMHKVMRPHKRSKWLFAYLTLLFVIVTAFFMVQPKVVIPNIEIEDPPSIFDTIHEGNDYSVLESYKVNEWDFTVKEEQIRLQVKYTGHWMDTYIPVIVIEDDAKIDEAHVVHYATPSTLNGVDISSYVQLPEIDVKEGIVTATIFHHIPEHELRSIQNSTVLRQFDQTDEDTPFFDMNTGELAIIMTIPKGTTIMADVDQFDIIRK